MWVFSNTISSNNLLCSKVCRYIAKFKRFRTESEKDYYLFVVQHVNCGLMKTLLTHAFLL